jgi:PKD repeat protein
MLRRLVALCLAVTAAGALGATFAIGAAGDPVPPTADFSIDPNPALTGQTITFDASGSTPGDGTITDYKWDLDGNPVNGFETDSGADATVTRSYGKAGSFPVRVLVIDSNGNTDQAQKTLTINDRPPTASFAIDPNPALVNDTVNFDASASTDPDGSIARYEWDLDGNTGNGFEVSGTDPTTTSSYSKTGAVTVRLRVTDDDDKESTTSQTLFITNNLPPAVSFAYAPANPVAGNTVTFFSTATDPDSPITSWAWDFDGDGQFDDATGQTAARTFPAPGVYTVGLEVKDAGGDTASGTKTVVVGPAPAPSLQQSTQSPRLLSPFPVVRIVGSVKGKGTLLRRFTVYAPVGSTVIIHCRGHGCPFRRQTRTTRSESRVKGQAPAAELMRIRRLERRLLRAGVTVKVFVTEPNTIGKFTRFKIRERRPPARVDRCLVPGNANPVQCPAV